MVHMSPLKFNSNNLLLGTTVFAGVAIPVSTAAQNISAALILICLFFTLNDWHKVKEACKKIFPLIGLILGVLLAAGTFWSSADPANAWRFFLKMRAYYLAPAFLVFFSNKKIRNYFLTSFAIATCITVILSCLSALFNYPIFKAIIGDWYIFRTHTYHNFFAALLGAGLLSILIEKKLPTMYRLLLFLILILVSYNILFLVAGRTGQIAYLSMLLMILVLWKWRFGLIIGIVMIISFVVLLPKYSSTFDFGIKSAESDWTAYSNGNSNTSVGLRLEWQQNSIRLIKEKPFFGHGTGSFEGEYARQIGSNDKLLASQNPHNDYLWLSVELGVMGGLLLLGLLLSAAWQGRYLLPAWKWSLYALLLGMGVSTLANSFFTDNITGLAFVLLTCALLNGPDSKSQYT